MEKGKDHLAVLDIFQPVHLPTGSTLSRPGTNNILFSTSIYKKSGLRFDTDFTKTGGSDNHFFHQAFRLGAYIAFSNEALIFSPVSDERTTWRWIARRHARLGATVTMSEIKCHNSRYAAKQVASSLLDSVIYALQMTRRVLIYKHPAIHPATILCFMAGRVMGLCHMSPREYN